MHKFFILKYEKQTYCELAGFIIFPFLTLIKVYQFFISLWNRISRISGDYTYLASKLRL